MEWLTNLLSTYGAEVLLSMNLGIISLKTFVIDKVVNKRIGNNINESMTFQRVAKAEINKVAKVVIDGFDDIKKEILKDIVNPLVAKLNASEKDNQLLKDAIVGLIPYVNVPIAQKKGFYTVIKSVATISADVRDAMSEAIQVEETLSKVSVEIDKGIELEIEGV